jgi:hypothetical protein
MFQAVRRLSIKRIVSFRLLPLSNDGSNLFVVRTQCSAKKTPPESNYVEEFETKEEFADMASLVAANGSLRKLSKAASPVRIITHLYIYIYIYIY